ncbi:hypothetical protein [Demequina aestuarii]|uniref:hypothetical protein n=1 Tax=Demequina aestuarii TaxID=327095 RepID=UPI000785E595|nr:hypothetical protein [Demequina aestuarii]
MPLRDAITRRWALAPTSMAIAVAIVGCGASPAAAGSAETLDHSDSSGACAAIEADVAPVASPGATLTVRLENLVETCHDQGEGPDRVLATVELTLVSVGTSDAVLATGEADVAPDATAVVELAVPADAEGALSIEHDRVSLAVVTVTG